MGRPRGVGGGLFLSSSGEAAGRVVLPSGGIASFRRAAMIPGASCSRHSHGGLPSAPHPLIRSHIEKPGKQAGDGHGGTVSAIVSRRGGAEDKQARRERRTTSPRFLSSHGPTTPHGSSSHIPSTQSPRSLDKHTTRRKNETPGQENEDEHENENEDEHGNDGQTTNTGTHGPARRQASNETHDETTNETPDNKTKDETRRKRQGAKIKHGRRGH